MVMSPNILEVMSFRMSIRVTATVVCCVLMQILCAVSQNSFSLILGVDPTGAPLLDPAGDFVPQTLYRGSTHRPHWGTSVLQTPSLLLFPPSNNPVRSTPLSSTNSGTWKHR